MRTLLGYRTIQLGRLCSTCSYKNCGISKSIKYVVEEECGHRFEKQHEDQTPICICDRSLNLDLSNPFPILLYRIFPTRQAGCAFTCII